MQEHLLVDPCALRNFDDHSMVCEKSTESRRPLSRDRIWWSFFKFPSTQHFCNEISMPIAFLRTRSQPCTGKHSKTQRMERSELVPVAPLQSASKSKSGTSLLYKLSSHQTVFNSVRRWCSTQADNRVTRSMLGQKTGRLPRRFAGQWLHNS
jgi:hypothetical protein